jgi:8-oxo-dGTP diphosphatase
VIVVAAALFDANNAILIQQRPQHKPLAGLWEFPGGKVESNETCPEALARELAEELSIEVDPACLHEFSFVTETAEGRDPLVLLLYCCRKWRGQPVSTDGCAIAWVRPDGLSDYALAPLDIPLAARLAAMAAGEALTWP